MSTFTQIFAATLLAMKMALPASTFAQTPTGGGHSGMSSNAMAVGEVKKVDLDQGKITIKHGHIQSIDMPPMTMVFTAKNQAVLDNVRAGDQIRFQAAMEGNKMIVTDIQSAN